MKELLEELPKPVLVALVDRLSCMLSAISTHQVPVPPPAAPEMIMLMTLRVMFPKNVVQVSSPEELDAVARAAETGEDPREAIAKVQAEALIKRAKQ